MFSYLFPKGGLGIEITTKYIRFVHLVKKGDLFHLKDFGRISIPQDVFVDGILEKQEVLKSSLKKILRETGEKQVRLIIPAESQKFFLLDLSKKSNHSLVEDIIFKLKENVSFQFGKDEIADIKILERNNSHITVRAVTLSSSEYKNFISMFKIFRKDSFHLERGSHTTITASLKQDTKMPRLHVQFGDDFSSYSIISKGKIVAYQEFPFSTYRFLLEVQKRLTKPSDIASSYLSQLGVLGADVRTFSEDVIKPIGFILDHAITDFGRDTGEAIQEVTIGGAFGGYKGVSEIIEKYLRINVKIAYPWKMFDSRFDDSIFEMKKQETLEYLPALGLAFNIVR